MLKKIEIGISKWRSLLASGRSSEVIVIACLTVFSLPLEWRRQKLLSLPPRQRRQAQQLHRMLKTR